MAWPGFKLKIDGQDRPLNRRFACEGGLRFLEIEGRIPAAPKGPLPLNVQSEFGPNPGPKPLLAWRTDKGFRAEFLPGLNADLDRPAPYWALWRLPVVRFGEDYKLVNYPAQVRLGARLTVPVSGLWQFRLAWPGGGNGRISVNGKPCMAQSDLYPSFPPEPVMLTAGEPVDFRVDYEMHLNIAPATAFILQAKAPGEKDYSWADPRWFTPSAPGKVRR
jgi:hypothetical protein